MCHFALVNVSGERKYNLWRAEAKMWLNKSQVTRINFSVKEHLHVSGQESEPISPGRMSSYTQVV